ncbi:MAG: endo alpha-1,4 polygalactosaminidase [Thermaceae bacterium]|nr:endo alpha-1,4 polygalactosaminidase [Thermaceae bacterium]
MDAISSAQPIALYYGAGELPKLARYQRVVLQPEFYSAAELAWLSRQGSSPIAYLSLSEDTGPPAPWQRPERNPDWGGAYVWASHPGWVNHVLNQAQSALSKGFQGLFLDTLDIAEVFPEEAPHVLMLVALLREATAPAYLMANRGFTLMPRLVEFVDGHLFESFSAAWTREGRYEAWPPPILEDHARLAQELIQTDLELFALDYADTPALEAFARRRARQFGLHPFVSDKALSRI